MSEQAEIKMGGAALLVAVPGRLRDGWQALLRATPEINTVYPVDDLPSALRMLDGNLPELVVLDAGPFGIGAWDLLRQLKARRSHSRCIALVCYSWQERDALLAGADEVLFRGFAAEEMFSAAKRLLPEMAVQ